MSNQAALIEALSNEITKSSDRIVSFRNRIAFLTWVAPILILGSAVVAASGHLPLRMINPPWVIIAGVVVVQCYMGLGWIAARIEEQAWGQVNRVRAMLIKVSNDANCKLTEEEYRDNIGRRLRETYLCACFLVIVSALCMCVMAFNVGTQLHAPQEAQNGVSAARFAPQQGNVVDEPKQQITPTIR